MKYEIEKMTIKRASRRFKVASICFFMAIIWGLFHGPAFVTSILAFAEAVGYAPRPTPEFDRTLTDSDEDAPLDVRIAFDPDIYIVQGRILKGLTVDRSYQAKDAMQAAKFTDIIRDKGYKLRTLRLLSHGNKDRFMMGSEILTAESLLNSPQMQGYFKRIGKSFSSDGGEASLIFEGCKVGRAKELLKLISALTGVKTIGFTANQRIITSWSLFGGTYGGLVICDSDNCTSESTTIADSFDSITDPAFGKLKSSFKQFILFVYQNIVRIV